MNFRNFTVQTALRAGLMFAALAALAFGAAYSLQPLILIVFAAIAIGLLVNLINYVNRANRAITNVLSGLRFGDYQNIFSMGELGKTFRDLEFILHLTIEKVRKLRLENEHQALYFKALVDHIPLPMFVLYDEGRVEVLNNALRRTFNVADITNIDDFEAYGAAFRRDVMQVEPGTSLLTTLVLDDIEQQFILTATQITLDGKVRKLISMQNVQSELDATELATWQNLLRVTSHEILNSLTPVSSLARTAENLVEDYAKTAGDKASEDLQDIRDALETLVRRSEGLTGFVLSYRQLTRMPPPKPAKISLERHFKRLTSLVEADWKKRNIKLETELDPKNISLVADEGMLDQAMINLLRNAADALGDTKNPKVKITARFDSKQRVVIEVADNGPGIDKDHRDKIFVPFFTTKKQGSGIGLTLVRYILLSHGGAVTCSERKGGGTVFRLTF